MVSSEAASQPFRKSMKMYIMRLGAGNSKVSTIFFTPISCTFEEIVVLK